MQIKLAFKNIFRNRVRSIITLSAIAFGAVSLIIAGGFFEDTFLQMREAAIHSNLGHIQIYEKGFIEKGAAHPFDYLIKDPGAIIALVKKMPHVKIVTERIGFSGLLSTGDNSYSAFFEGISPGAEAKLNVIKGIKGANSGVAIQSGRQLKSDDAFEIVVGRGLAKSIGTAPGKRLTLLTNTVGGSLNALDLTVSGIFFTASKEYDDRVARLPIRTAQRLLRTKAVQRIVVVLDKTRNTPIVKAALEEMFRKDKLNLELRTWNQMADFYRKTVELYRRQFLVFELIIGIIVVLGIFNTLNMSIWERTREIGTIMAMGFRRSEILKLFLLEGILLGCMGSIIGIAFGTILAYIISTIGIPMPPPPGATVGWTAGIRLVPHLIVTAFAIPFVSAVVSALYPAYKASRMIIADALRHI